MLASETKTVGTVAATRSPADPTAAWKQIVAPVEPFLQSVSRQLGEQIQAFEADVATYAEYALTAHGKQLRPALVALSGGAVGTISEAHVVAAVIIEMVHLATLVHDDVIDEAQMRRGRPTLAANWGNEISVLVGDCLFAHALKLAASFPTPDVCRAVAAATNTVCAGEILQTQRRHDLELSQEEYFRVLQMKTGELFALSCDLGGYLSGGGRAAREPLRRYGLIVGTAYQIYDDCLDLFGSESLAGKSLGTDLAKGKLTLPMLLLLQTVEAAEREMIRAWLLDWEPRHFRPVMHLLREHAVLDESRKAVHQLLDAARHALEPLRESESRAGLLGFVNYLAQQTDSLGGGA